MRGGIAYGRYSETKLNGNLFVVSDALVRAVRLEASVGLPAIAISDEIKLGIEVWIPRFEHGLLGAPVLHFRGMSFANPFGAFWFRTPAERLQSLHDRFPEHGEKFAWFLELVEAISRDDLLVPEGILERLQELGVVKPIGPDT